MLVHDVIVIGAGPAGLATAIAAKRAGLSAVVLEKGVLVNSLFHFPTHMVFFTTPELISESACWRTRHPTRGASLSFSPLSISMISGWTRSCTSRVPGLRPGTPC